MGKLNHVNIAAEDAATMAAIFADVVGLTIVEEDVVPSQGVKVVKLGAGETVVEITEPLGPDTPVGKFIAKRGQGIHHLAFEVPDLEAKLAELKSKGVRLINEEPTIGAGGHRIAFVHPASFGGILVELLEK
ncbi:MAG: methylmalonyl-CoA epimerase, partial [Planctomycetota bacterium]